MRVNGAPAPGSGSSVRSSVQTGGRSISVFDTCRAGVGCDRAGVGFARNAAAEIGTVPPCAAGCGREACSPESPKVEVRAGSSNRYSPELRGEITIVPPELDGWPPVLGSMAALQTGHGGWLPAALTFA